MTRFPGNSNRASTYAAIAPSSIVPISEHPTTRTVLRKKSPMFDLPQARDQLSKCSAEGSPQGEVKISLSVLRLLITAHSSGMVTSSPQITSMPCEKTLRTLPSLPIRPSGVKRGGRRPARAASGGSSSLVTRGSSEGSACEVTVVPPGRRSSGGSRVRSRAPASVLQPFAPAEPAHDDREDQGDDQHRDADRGRASGLPVVEGLGVHVVAHDLGGVGGSGRTDRHDLH